MNDDPSKKTTSPKASTPASAKTEATKESLKQDARALKENLDKEAAKVGAQAESEATEALSQAGSEIDDLTYAIDAAADSLSDSDKDGLARYARQLSDQLSTLAQDLQNKSASDLAADARSMANKNPAGFFLGSIALGFGLSRFAKASTTRDDSNVTKKRAGTDGTTEQPKINPGDELFAHAAPAEAYSPLPTSEGKDGAKSQPKINPGDELFDHAAPAEAYTTLPKGDVK